ncbi:coiled-coil domain-containing protein 180 isoform X5 [Girardinichthys multiradiatus]|uniref:coiled-coil domain-containing protein 180 isoform X5 n=1 Tax=Girardinichthys multiradiatus TaxID=208333 RepID=UPI001FABFB6E|nr:coiled-coil domain-containing protein 180 isoform X5 [Girardinichthys multiradiatus]
MCESRAVPSREVNRQLFDAQAQLSRSLLAGHRVQKTDSLSPADSSRVCSPTSRGQQMDDEDDGFADVRKLPDSVAINHPSSGIVERLSKKRGQKHDAALKQLEADLTHLSQVCELEVRTNSEQVRSSLREVDLRLDTLKGRIGQQEPGSLQAWHSLWEAVEEEVRLKKICISELDKKLSGVEEHRSLEIKVVLRKHFQLLEQISFLSPPDVHRLMHAEAMKLNQSLLANQRSIAWLVLRLKEDHLQQESLLRLLWKDCLDRWRSNRVEEVVERLKGLCSRDKEQELFLDQQMKQTQEDLIQQRCEIIYKICSLVPPICSSALVSDWLDELTAVNQQIDHLHADLLHQMRGLYEHTWQHHLAEVENCKVALLALQLSDQQVKEIIASQLLPLIGQLQRQDEERLAALDVCSDSVGRHSLQVSRSVFEVMRASALLWEMHCRKLERREEELKGQLEVLSQAQQKHVQKKMVHMDVLLGALRQESSEAAMQMCLHKTLEQLQDMEDSCRQSISDQCELLDQLPALLMEELLSYSISISSFFRLSHAYRPSPAELQNFPPLNIRSPTLVLAELQLHQKCVDIHCQEISDILTSCRKEFQDLQNSIQKKNQELFNSLASCEMELQTSIQKNNQDGLEVASSSIRGLEVCGTTLQNCLDRQTEDTQNFKQLVQSRLEEARKRTGDLLKSFRMFSEGRDLAPQEDKMFRRRLKEETKQISATEKSIFSELELLESKSLQQVRKVSSGLEDKLSSLRAEVKFTDEVQKIISRTQIQIKAEVASSNLQQSKLSSRLEDLRMMMKNMQVSPDQICSFFLSTNEQMKMRCFYLDFNLDSAVKESLALSGHPEPREQVRCGSLQLSRTAVDLHEEQAVSAVRFTLLQDSSSENQQRGRKAADQSSTQHQQRSADSISTLSMRISSRSIRTEVSTGIRTKKKFQIFGSKQEAELSTHSFNTSLTSILWRSNDALLLLAEEFYCSKRPCSLNLLPESVDQWAESIQQRLLGYQEQGRRFLSVSRDEVVKQLSVFRELLNCLPDVLINDHEGQQGARLTEEVGEVRKKLEEKLAASEKEKISNVRHLRVSLSDNELEALNSREELRQQQVHSAIHSTHLELQECVRGRAEEFVTSLSSLTEKLLHLLDEMLTAAEPPRAVTMETGAETGSELSRGSRTWTGIAHLSLPTNNSGVSPVTMTTASITTARSSLKRGAVIENRDAALKRWEQLIRSEVSRSDVDRRNQLSKQESWTSYWRQEILTLRSIQKKTGF